ncbi:MAG TPA: pantoate--beta-alanine ligase [Pirellulales bacterium]|jgi:pantoate--beta-alanine ligase|nr:pantoate--beta-alanine ligase [Pirellulales bacterium]
MTPKLNTPAAPPRVLGTCEALRAAVREAREAGKTIGLVPTMGALHAGHLSLVEAATRQCDFTIVTIFVNPTQFAPHEDFSKYPRTLEADLAALAPLGADVVFAPASPAEIYAHGFATTLEVGGVAESLEGRSRPGHFAGVATVVLKLFNLSQADVAFFGAKDFQQALVVRQMVRDLNVPIEARVCPIVREADGLAMSSRNRYLDPHQRRQALVLSRSLRRAAELVAAGERDAATIVAAMREVFATAPDIRVEYIVVGDPETLAPLERIDHTALAAVAAQVGSTRLIDNQMLEPNEPRSHEPRP